MFRRNLWLCGLGLLAIGTFGMARSAAVDIPGTLSVSDSDASSVRGAAYCPKLKKDDLVHCKTCNAMNFYVTDDNGTITDQRCYKYCESGGMACGDPCDACEILLPCDHPICDSAGNCPETVGIGITPN